jgi:spermidine/putrescine-binding protein
VIGFARRGSRRTAAWRAPCVVLVLVALTVAGCGGAAERRSSASPLPSPESGALLVLTTRGAMPQVVARGFRARYPGVELRLTYATNEFDLDRRLEAGARPDLVVVRSDGDVAPAVIGDAVRPVDVERIAGWRSIGPAYRSLAGRAGVIPLVPVAAARLGLIVRAGAGDYPRSYAGLFAARYRGRIALPDNAAVAFQAAALSLGFDAGRELGARESEQVRILLKGHHRWLRASWRDATLAGRLFADGQIDVTLGTQADLRRMERSGVSLRLVAPREGTLVSLLACGMGRRAVHPAAAYTFISYLLEPRAQVALALGTGMFPVNAAAASVAPPRTAARLGVGAPGRSGRTLLLEPELAHTDWIQTWYSVKTGLACCL